MRLCCRWEDEVRRDESSGAGRQVIATVEGNLRTNWCSTDVLENDELLGNWPCVCLTVRLCVYDAVTKRGQKITMVLSGSLSLSHSESGIDVANKTELRTRLKLRAILVLAVEVVRLLVLKFNYFRITDEANAVWVQTSKTNKWNN